MFALCRASYLFDPKGIRNALASFELVNRYTRDLSHKSRLPSYQASLTMSAFNRKRKASPPDHVGQSKRSVLNGKDRMLCKCSVAIQLSCTGCGHACYISCPPEKPSISTSHSNFVENVREEHEQTLTPSPSLRPRFSDWQSLSQEFLTSGRDEELEMGQDVEESQAQELPLQPTEEQQPVETERPSKRSLDMNKCERCRQDKKKVRYLYAYTPLRTSAAFKDNNDSRSRQCLKQTGPIKS